MSDIQTNISGEDTPTLARPLGDVILRTEGLTKHYGGVHALIDCNFEVRRGEHVAIMGDNGAGKSTFVRQITAVEKRTGGKIWFDGRYVDFAGPLEAFSILDYKGMREATLAGLKKTGVKIPNISNTIQNMSGGQRQCVAIARTATFHSKLTIMDEPTAALGVQETAQVENIIRTLKEQGEPLILISHNMRQVMELCDRIVVWRRGRVCANLRKEETDGQDVVAYITGAKTQAEYADAT
jgi:fructose transport system ATP-binding protein